MKTHPMPLHIPLAMRSWCRSSPLPPSRSSRWGRSVLALCASAALLSGCSTPQVQDYAAQTPVLELRDYFNGTLDAYGIFTDRSG